MLPPLSFAQQRLWFLEQLEPGNVAYNIPLAVRLRGRLDVNALRASLQEIVRRHEALRTRFTRVGDQPAQVITPELSLAVTVDDLRDLPEAEREPEARRRVLADAQQPFDLTRAPLLRVRLLRLDDEDHVLLLTVHHIVFDGWSSAVFSRELIALYEAYSNGQPSPLQELDFQYADYALWQRNWLQGEAIERQLAYWRRQLAGSSGILELPADRVRPAVQSFRGSYLSLELGLPLTDALHALSQRSGASLFMTLLAAFQTLLHRYSRQDDLNVGTPIAGRNRSELEGLIGLFVNTLVLRADLSGDPTFRELLGRTREAALGAYAHQDVPFEKLVDTLQLPRDQSRNPLFQVMFVLQNIPWDGARTAGVEAKPFEFDVGTAKFDLTLAMQEGPTGLKAWWEYNVDLFDATTIERMAAHFRTLLEGIVADPDRPLSALPVLTASERRQLLAWGEIQAEHPTPLCLHERFAARAAETPDAVAITCEDRHLTYRDLDRRANRVAHALRQRGVGPDVLVGLCAERSLDLVVGILGVLKAGGAYVPLDPSYPKERLAFMLGDTRAPVLLTQQTLLDRLPDTAAEVLCLDADWPGMAPEAISQPASEVRPDHLAYVIYTSGSTGTPKGVMVTHGNVARLFDATNNWFHFDADDVWTLFHSYAFDFSVWELWGALLYGGRLVVVPYWVSRSPDAFRALLAREGVTVLNQTPSAFRQLIAADASALPSDELKLRYVIFGGEALEPATLRPWYARYADCRPQLVNMYGITETTVHVTYRPLTCADAERAGSPIGGPIPDLELYILDHHGEPVPIGVPGELCVGGAGVARGYLNRPELTAERFIPHPFSAKAGARLYRSGDLARYLPDGSIDFLGRIDQQVKIRGFRIELGEIEAALTQHPDVREAVVVVREDRPGEKRLVAYVVPRPTHGLEVGELRRYLGERLPDYMVPAAWVRVDHLPLTTNGKLDRAALPAPEWTAREAAYVAPRRPYERQLADIWARVLQVEQVGIEDNFFELGGDSILSLQVVARANQAGLRLTPRQLFECPTVAQLAAVAGTVGLAEAQQGIVEGAAPLTPIQRWFFERELPEAHHWNQAVLLETAPGLDPSLLRVAVESLLAHHDALRLRFSQGPSGWQQVNAGLDSAVPFTYEDLSGLPDAEQRAALEARASALQTSLDLAAGPLLRVAHFGFGPRRTGRLLVAIHHLTVDGVSWRILLEDLAAAYSQLAQGEPVHLPKKTTAFRDWAQQLAEYAQTEPVRGQLDFWLDTINQPAGSLPVDYPGGANTEASTRVVTVALEPAETQALLQQVPAAYGAEINDLLLAPLAQALARLTGSTAVRVDLEGHGREDVIEGIDLSRTVGWFTTLFPVRLDLARVDGPAPVLERVKKQLRRVPARGLGYGLLRYMAEGEVARALSAGPREVCFNYLGQFDQVFAEGANFRPAAEASGPLRCPRARRSHLLEINASVIGGRLTLAWSYSANLHRQATVEALAADYTAALRALIEHGRRVPPAVDTLLAIPDLPLERQNVEDVYGLSPMQEGLLFQSVLAPESGEYFEQLAVTLDGRLDLEAFEQAWRRALERHPILRTAFVWQRVPKMLQVVYRQVELPVERHDWRGLSADDQAEQLDAYLAADRQRGFDLARAPLMRLALIRLADESTHVVWSHHHLLLDGWSLPQLFAEIAALYEAGCRGEEARLAPRRPYKDYITWLERQDWASAEAFWRRTLAGFATPTPLPLALAAPGTLAGGKAAVEGELSREGTAALRAFARGHGLTLNSVVQGAWALLLSRHSGEADVLFGSVVSGRQADLPGAESMLGLFVNSLPVRARVPGDVPLVSWLRDLQAEQAELRQYEYSPLVRVQQLSEVPSGQPLFESLLVFENYPLDASLQSSLGSLTARDPRFVEWTSFPLTVMVTPGAQLGLKLAYDVRRFDTATIERLLAQLQGLLEDMAANPTCRLADLSLLGEAEREQILRTWNATTLDCPAAFIHELFEAQVRRTPDAPALRFRGQPLSYRELNARANRLARRLRALQVTPESVVGVCLERSPDMVVALLAVLKAGGAYLPLDPAYPRERLAFMLEDARVPVLITRAGLVDALPTHAARVICLDADAPLLAAEASENLGLPLAADTPAYVIYTSGSTGQPKGVVGLHRGAVNRFAWMWQAYPFQPGEVGCQKTTLGFVDSVWEIFGPLLRGVPLVLVPEDAAADPRRLVEVLARERATRLVLVPSLLRAIVDAYPDLRQRLPDLHLIVSSGEPLTADLARRLLAALPGVTLLNLYGASEASADSTCYEVRAGAVPDRVPIGRPIANTRLYILDPQRRPVPIGVPGELYIGGVGLARGYLNRPDLTAEKFIADPFAATPGARLYRTGDRARYLPDGTVEHLGRIDQQVKLRGIRIEPGEIEAALAAHAGVGRAVVVVREDESDNPRLVAYVVPEGRERLPGGRELRQFLRDRLPEYMVPSAFVALVSLPLTPNAKIDRAALPAPGSAGREDDYVAPRTPTEEALADLWGEVLRLERVGAADNFFALGGHSLLATQIVSRVRDVFGVDLPLRALFEAPTVADLAAVITEQQAQLGLDEELTTLLAKLEGLSEAELQALLPREEQ